MAESPIPVILTIWVDPEALATIRVSRVSAHGEEILTPTLELAGLCGYIYQHLAKGNTLGGEAIKERLLEASQALMEARKASIKPLEKVSEAISVMEGIMERLDRIEMLLKDRVLTVDNTEQWIKDIATNHPSRTTERRGQ